MNTQPIEIKNETGNGIPLAAEPVGGSAKAAYERRLAEIRAVPDGELCKVLFDVHASVATVLGALPGILVLRETMATLPNLKAALVDGLEDYAWAASEANSRYGHATAPSQNLGPLLEEAMKVRETFRLDAVSLAHRGFIERERLAAFKGFTGFKNVAFDLMDWAFVMRECWSRIEGKSGLSAEEVDAAARLGEHLLTQASLREQQPERIVEAAHIRRQALTLMVTAYAEVRRALTYLRWQEDDVESIAPSLYVKNGRRKQKGEAEATAGPTPPPDMPGARSFVDA